MTKVNNSEKVKYKELFFYTLLLCNKDLLLYKEVLYKHFPTHRKINMDIPAHLTMLFRAH